MDDEPQWIILLPPAPGGTTATPVGLFDSEQEAWDHVARLPTEQGLRAHVLRLKAPNED